MSSWSFRRDRSITQGDMTTRGGNMTWLSVFLMPMSLLCLNYGFFYIFCLEGQNKSYVWFLWGSYVVGMEPSCGSAPFHSIPNYYYQWVVQGCISTFAKNRADSTLGSSLQEATDKRVLLGRQTGSFSDKFYSKMPPNLGGSRMSQPWQKWVNTLCGPSASSPKLSGAMEMITYEEFPTLSVARPSQQDILTSNKEQLF